MADHLNSLSALGPRGIQASVWFDTDTDTFLGGIITAFSDGLVIRLIELFMTGSAHQQVLCVTGSAVIYEFLKAFDTSLK